MSKRRMFHSEIVGSDAFVDMPMSAQALYFHMCLHADDDGFVSRPKQICRMVGANDDDLKILYAKRFILSFDSGVAIIKHWLIHNLIRSDLYVETTYKTEKATLGLNEFGAYTELREGVIPIKKIEEPVWLKKRRSTQSKTGVDDDQNRKRDGNVPQTVHTRHVGQFRLGKVSTVVTENEDVDNSETGKTGFNEIGKGFVDVNALYDDLKQQDLVNDRFKGWYCKTFFKVGRERVMILASQAKADTTGDKKKLFSHLLKQEIGVKTS